MALASVGLEIHALGCVSHWEKVIKFLVERAWDLGVDSKVVIIPGAVRTLNTTLLNFLVSRGVDPTVGTPLFSLVELYPSEVEKAMDAKDARSGFVDIEPPVPFSRRRSTAYGAMATVAWCAHGRGDKNEMSCLDLAVSQVGR